MTVSVKSTVAPTRLGEFTAEVTALLDAPEASGEFRDLRAGLPILINLLMPTMPRRKK